MAANPSPSSSPPLSPPPSSPCLLTDADFAGIAVPLPPLARYLVFEGIDGSGKTTQARLLAEALRSRGFKVLLTFEPTHGPHGRMIREAAQKGALDTIDELALFLKDRREHIETSILPALQEGQIVIQDRSLFSTLAYQGSRKFGIAPTLAALQAIPSLHSFALAPALSALLRSIVDAHRGWILLPTRLFLFQLPVSVALARIQQRRASPSDAFEEEQALEATAALFASICPSSRLCVDATLPPDQLHALLLASLSLV